MISKRWLISLIVFSVLLVFGLIMCSIFIIYPLIKTELEGLDWDFLNVLIGLGVILPITLIILVGFIISLIFYIKYKKKESY